MPELDDCEHRYSPFELDGVPMWRCIRCKHVYEDEWGEEEGDEDVKGSVFPLPNKIKETDE